MLTINALAGVLVTFSDSSSYTPAKRSLQGVYWNHCVGRLVGWLVGRAGGRSVTFCSESLCRKLLLHLLSDWLQTWNMTSSWVVDVQDTNFMFTGPSLPELCALELSNIVDRGIFATWKFVSRTTSTFVERLTSNLDYDIIMSCRCARHKFHVQRSKPSRVMCPWT